MRWKCPSCGFDNDVPHPECKGGCGYEPIPMKLSLVAATTGKAMTISITTTFCKDLLRSFAGDEAVYASNPQFVIKKDVEAGGWFLEHAPSAKNPTFVNGSTAVSAHCKLQGSHFVTIGPEKMRLEVRFP